ncbi:MAG: hypothetical protein IJO31_00770, partial [Oscillospiraceae bacterium]|nr:hypothetical protein [Oscillospiraceae bacterium]
SKLKQIHQFVQGVLFVFALFNLQGTSRFALRRSLLILAHPIQFVKNFFQVFSTFFSAVFRFAPLSLSA